MPKQQNLHFRWKPAGSHKKPGNHINKSLSQQPLIKCVTLVRYEVNAVMQLIEFRAQCTQTEYLTNCFESLDSMSFALSMRTSFQILRMSITYDFDFRATA